MPKSTSEIIISLDAQVVEALDHYNGTWDKIKGIVKVVTPEIENLFTSFRGSDKKIEATKVINGLIDRHLPIPFWVKPFQGFIVSRLIDTVVAAFNRLGIFKHKS